MAITKPTSAGGRAFISTRAGSFSNTNPLTLSCWFYYQDQTRACRFAGASFSTGGLLTNGSRFQFLNITTGIGPLRFNYWGSTGNSNVDTTNGMTTGDWNHCLGRINGTTQQVSVNGGGFNSNTLAPAVGPVTSVWFPTDVDAGAQLGNNRVGEVAVWTTILSDEDCLGLSQGFSPAFFKPTKLHFYAPLLSTDYQMDKQTENSLYLVNTSSISTGNPGADFVTAEHPRIIYPRKGTW